MLIETQSVDVPLNRGSRVHFLVSQTTEEAWDDDALFQNGDDEEEDGQFVMYVR